MNIIETEFILKEILDLIHLMPDTSDSGSSSDSSEILSSNEEGTPEKRVCTRIKDYIEVVHRYSNSEFKSHFRVCRTTFDRVVGLLKESNFQPKNVSGRQNIEAEKAFLLVLWYFCNQESFRQISDRFDVTLSSAYRCLRRVLQFLLSIRKEVIRWPTENEKIVIRQGFLRKRGISNIFGAIDGSHVEIPKPAQNQHAYINRKGYHSLLLQGVVDHRKKFIDVFCGQSGSLHDARLLRKSNLFTKILNNQCITGEDFLVGDTAYPNTRWLITPFKNNGHLTVQQHSFNYNISASRIVVEKAFGLLKCRFRRLRKLDNIDKQLCSEIIMGACVMHNICIDVNDLLEREENDYNQPEHVPQQNDQIFLEDLNRRQQVFNEMVDIL